MSKFSRGIIPDSLNLYKEGMDKFGFQSQLTKLGEESAELATEIFRAQNNLANIDKVIVEMIDVLIMIEQMSMYFDEQHFNKVRMEKLSNFKQRLREEEDKQMIKELE